MDGNNKGLGENEDLVKGLLEANAYPHETGLIQLMETHISWVFLTGQYAYKVKKPVDFGFLDFSTLDKRKFYCQEELRLNQRLAKAWYLDVVPITGTSQQPIIDGTGTAIDYAVKMQQFPTSKTLKELAENGKLNAEVIDQIAQIIADFHAGIDKAAPRSPYGSSKEIKHWFDENFHHIRPLLDDKQPLFQLETIANWGNKEWQEKSPFMQQRKQEGYVRECHGDLHLGNMTITKGRVLVFDCIEFNPSLRWIDVISEAAFLVMDLTHLGHDGFAYRFLNRYLQHTGDYKGLALLHFYLAYRAFVRAKVALLRKAQNPSAEIGLQISAEYADYANLAERFAKTSPPVLMITHGFSGSGKSFYASQLAEKIGAIQIRSDIERKRLFGYQAQAKTHSSVESGVYALDATRRTYHHLAELGKAVLEAGFSVIVDAAFLKLEQRKIFCKLAEECQAKFIILNFQASEETLANRIKQRQNDPSEATIAVLHNQQQTAELLSSEEARQAVVINTELNGVLEIILGRIGISPR